MILRENKNFGDQDFFFFLESTLIGNENKNFADRFQVKTFLYFFLENTLILGQK